MLSARCVKLKGSHSLVRNMGMEIVNKNPLPSKHKDHINHLSTESTQLALNTLLENSINNQDKKVKKCYKQLGFTQASKVLFSILFSSKHPLHITFLQLCLLAHFVSCDSVDYTTKRCLRLILHVIFGSLPAFRSVEGQAAFSLQSNHARVH